MGVTEGSVPPPASGAIRRSFPTPIADGDRIISAFAYLPTAAAGQRDTVVVLCNALGWEAVASGQTMRQLATRLAAEGFPVLRFDYLGTGDSSGTDDEPGRVRAWLGSVKSAIAHAKRWSGRDNVALVGLHVGATLAALSAIDVGGVASLTLWAPYAKGRTYVRETKAYYALSPRAEAGPPPPTNGDIEVAGFLLTEGTLADLGALDLTTATQSPAPHTLVLGRDGNGAEKPIVRHFGALGSHVEHDIATGYADLMQDPRRSAYPAADCQRIISFLTRVHPLSSAFDGALNAVPTWSATRYVANVDATSGERLIETTLGLGPSQRLFGVLTERDGAAADRFQKPLIVFLNTAPHTRIGPNRMYVPLARALAERGFPSLRFDLSSVGDSAPSPETAGQIYSKAFVKDVSAAMDSLQGAGFSRFVLVGLCSGAYLAFHSAAADARVNGVVMINPQTFNWKDGDSLEVRQGNAARSTTFYQRRLFNPETWQRAMRGEIDFRTISRAFLGRAEHRAKSELKRALMTLRVVKPGTWVDVGSIFDGVLKRGTTSYMVYSSDDEGLDHLRSQVGSRLRRLSKHRNFRLDVVPGPDHTFSQVWAQQRLQSLLLTYLADRFG